MVSINVPNSVSRRSFVKGLATAGAGVLAAPSLHAQGANKEVRVAVIGMGVRGKGHFSSLSRVPGVKVVAVCDADKNRMRKYAKDGVLAVQDYRKILEMKDVDAITIATPNHWHASMTVAGCQAGKHVYVEKPVSHSLWESQQMIKAARKYNRIVQGGNQQRSCPSPQAAAKDIAAGKYGKVLWVHCMKLNHRKPIGLVTKPTPVPEGVDYNLWAGPAPATPIMRKQFHYDWHWQFDWGDGEMGNWAVHYTDDLCHMLGWETLPEKVCSAGGRFVWDDNGDTPNMHFTYMEHQGVPIMVEIRDLPHSASRKAPTVYKGTRGGNIIMCEKGMIKLARGGGKAYETNGKKVIKAYPGNAGKGHFANFIDAIRSGKKDDLAAEIATGHISTGVCHLANISYKLGQQATPDQVREAMGSHQDARDTINSVVAQVKANNGSLDPMQLGPMLTFDPKTEKFVGKMATQANTLMKLPQRDEFAIPDQV